MKASELRPGQFFECDEVRHHSPERPRRRLLWTGTRLGAIDIDGCSYPRAEHSCTVELFTGWDDEPQSEPASISKELNIDAGTEHFELARALHRVVRAMHDGHCPKCGHLASSMEFEPSEGYHCCPNCEFAITKEESDEALAMFLPYMQKNYDKFVAWQLHGRFVKPVEPAPLQLREGAWYRRRDGEVVGPAELKDPDTRQPWSVVWWYPDSGRFIHYKREDHPYDLIAEVPPPVEPGTQPEPLPIPPTNFHAESTSDAGENFTNNGANSLEQFKAGDWVVWNDTAPPGEAGSAEYVGLERGKAYQVHRADSEFVYLSSDDYDNHYHFRFRRATPAADADGWIEWRGGECPVSPTTKVDVRFREPLQGEPESIWCNGEEASEWEWDHSHASGDIVAYRIAKPAPIIDWVEVVTR